jgi:prepilin-type N-terminal cleavage/methylation domain-containing protein
MARPTARVEGAGMSGQRATQRTFVAPRMFPRTLPPNRGGSGGGAVGARGLTLIEILVVIVIIGILASLIVTVASKVSQGGKVGVTQEALKIADQALNSYVQEKGAIPPPIFEDPRDKDRLRLIPVADARNMDAGSTDRVMINSVGLFIHQAEQDAGLTGLFANVDRRMLQRYDPDRTDGAYSDPDMDQMSPENPPTSFVDQPRIPTLMDGFGRPLRYVHPAFGGLIMGPSRANPTNPQTGLNMDDTHMFEDWTRAGNRTLMFSYREVRRNAEEIAPASTNPNPEFRADSDGGRPVGNRPYFYSAGPDEDPSEIEDNVYTGGSKPEFDKKGT